MFSLETSRGVNQLSYKTKIKYLLKKKWILGTLKNLTLVAFLGSKVLALVLDGGMTFSSHLCRYCSLWGLIPLAVLFSPKHTAVGKKTSTH